MAFCRLILEDGSFFELEDGSPFLLESDDCDEPEEGGVGRRRGAGVSPPKRRRYDVEALLLVLLAEDGRRFTPLI